MNPRTQAGYQAKAAGDFFEEFLNTQHEKAKFLGILAHIEKTQAKTRMIHGRLQYVEKGWADYIGCLEGGRYLALEAKSTKDSRFPKSEISHKQQDHLDRVAKTGGLALLLIEFRYFEGSIRFAIPWQDIPWKIKRTAESISAEDLSCFVIDPDCYLKSWHAGGKPTTAFVIKHRYPRE